MKHILLPALGNVRLPHPEATECEGYFNATGSSCEAPSIFVSQSQTHLGWVQSDDLATNLMRVIDVQTFYPAILMFFAIVMTFYYKCFMKVYASANAKVVLMEKKALISSAMSTALNWKVSATKLRQEKLEKIHDQMNSKEENEDIDADPDNELEKSDAQVQYELDLQIPPPLKLYELLYDENEQNRSLYFGIDRSKYEKVEKLLWSSLKTTLSEYTKSTQKARQPKKFPLLKWQHFSEVLPFQDGIRLKELVQLVQKKIKKNVGSHVIPAEDLQAAENCLQKIGAERTGGYKILLQMTLPSLPFLLATLILSMFKTWGDVMVFASRSAMLNDVSVSSKEGLHMIQQTTLSFLVLRGVFECIGMLCHFLRSKAAEKFSLPLRTAVMQGLLRQDIEYFDRQKLQPLINAATEESGKLAWVFFQLPLEMVSCITGMVTATAFIYSLAPDMFLLTMVPCIIMGTTHYFICQYMEKKWIRRQKLRDNAKEKTSELLNKIRTIREFAMEISESQKRSAMDAYSVEVETQISSFETCIWHSFGIFWAIQHGVITHFGSEQIYNGSLQLGTLMAMSHQMGRITWGLRHLLERGPEIFKALEPAQRISDILTAFGSIEGDPFQNKEVPMQKDAVTNGFRRPKRIQGKIEFKNVKFSYPSDPRKKILRDLSFSTNPTCKDPKKRVRTIAFVGETGCGKSTAINLLKKFYTQTSGEILLDGNPLREYDPRYLRQQMAIVSQNTQLLKKSLRDNITYGMPYLPSESDIISACKKASIWNDILEMPDKLDTVFDDNLSGGQKQRISIARALIRKPTILLLDEATSALDAVNERAVQSAINRMMDERGEGCSITIAHRLSTIRKSDLIIVMDKGKQVEAGTHDELMKLTVVKSESGNIITGWYRNLWDTQQGNDINKS